MSYKFNFIKRYNNKNVVMGHHYYLYNKQRHNNNLKRIFYYKLIIRMMRFKKKKYSCIFCSDTNETSSPKVFLCRECRRIKDYLRQYGMKSLLSKIEYNTDNIKASAPPYNN